MFEEGYLYLRALTLHYCLIRKNGYVGRHAQQLFVHLRITATSFEPVNALRLKSNKLLNVSDPWSYNNGRSPFLNNIIDVKSNYTLLGKVLFSTSARQPSSSSLFHTHFKLELRILNQYIYSYNHRFIQIYTKNSSTTLRVVWAWNDWWTCATDGLS
jgi:hypothetical protein